MDWYLSGVAWSFCNFLGSRQQVVQPSVLCGLPAACGSLEDLPPLCPAEKKRGGGRVGGGSNDLALKAWGRGLGLMKFPLPG